MTAVTLRPATPTDAPTIGRIWNDAWQDAHLGNVPDALVSARTPQSFQVRAAAMIPDTTIAVITDDPQPDVQPGQGQIAGFVTVVDDEVEQVYVADAHRGTGIAATLLAEAERRVAAAGHTRAWLAVVAGNTRARRFYARRGWNDEGPFDYTASVPGAEPIPVPSHRYVKPVTATVTGSAVESPAGA